MIPAALIPALTLAPAAPVDLESAEVACIADALTPAERIELGGALYGGARGRGVIDRMAEALGGCARRHGWNQQRADDMSLAAYGMLVRARGAALLDEAGIGHRMVDAWFDVQSEAARTSRSSDALPMDSLVAALHSQGVGRATIAAAADSLATYLRTRTALERLRRGLRLD